MGGGITERPAEISAEISEACRARAARLPPRQTRRETVSRRGQSTRGRRSLSLLRGPTTAPSATCVRETVRDVMDTVCVRERDRGAPRCPGSLITINPYSQRAKDGLGVSREEGARFRVYRLSVKHRERSCPKTSAAG